MSWFNYYIFWTKSLWNISHKSQKMHQEVEKNISHTCPRISQTMKKLTCHTKNTGNNWDLIYLPKGLDLRQFFPTLSSDLVDVLGCCLHHLLYPFLLQLLLSSLKQRRCWNCCSLSGIVLLSGGFSNLFLSLFEEQTEALVLLDPGRQLPLSLLPCLLQLHLQLPQNPQLLSQPGLPCPGHLKVQLQVQGSAEETVQTFHLHCRLARGQTEMLKGAVLWVFQAYSDILQLLLS